MSTDEKIALLQEFKTVKWFDAEHWDDREIEISEELIVRGMYIEVKAFIHFLMHELREEATNLENKIEAYFKEWDNELYNQDETEFIVDVCYKAMQIAGIKIDDLLI